MASEMTTPAIEADRDQQAVEAVANAMTFGKWGTLDDALKEYWLNKSQAAIAAYLAASGVGRDAERYRLLRQKVCIISKGENAEFQIINLRPFYIAPCPDMELDAVLDAFLAQESK